MIEELMFLNHWLISKDTNFPKNHGLDKSYFISLFDVYEYIEKCASEALALPTLENVAVQFDDFRIIDDLDPINITTAALKENKAFIQLRPLLEEGATLATEGKSLEAIYKLRNDLDGMIKQFANSNMAFHDWIKNAMERFERYMEKHGNEGLAGLTTGLQGLDEVTGGIRSDDFILLAGRTNEGKSFIALYLAYMAWRALSIAKMDDPVIYITTEMPEIEIAYRLDTLRQHFSNRALNEGRLPDPELYKEYLEELTKFKNSFIIMSQEANGGKPFTPDDIRLIVENHKPALVVIDQLYDLSDGTKEWDIRRKIVNVSTKLRDVVMYTQTPMILVAQAGREAARSMKNDPNASPEIEQIQESDNPAQKATKVITIRRINDIFKLSLKKNRGGPKDVDVFVRSSLDDGFYEEISDKELAF